MGRPGVQMWMWTLCVLLSWMCVKQVAAGSPYVVTIPAVLESGAQANFCVTLLPPSETVLLTVTLSFEQKNLTLLNVPSSKELNTCTPFKVPAVQKDVIGNVTVEIRGSASYSKEVVKVMIKVYQPMTLIQTDKPIYLPGQTVNFRVFSLDTKLKPVNQLYDVIYIQDVNNNRIGQWLNKMSNGAIVQLSYTLNPEAREGTYKITASTGQDEVNQDFKVEKYVLPKFSVTIVAPVEVSVGQTEFTADVCAAYTYNQPVPGTITVGLCRPVQQYIYSPVPVTAPCYNASKQTNKTGCATFTFKMSPFTNADKMLQDVLDLLATVEEEGTGVLQKAERMLTVSYVLGRLAFIDAPKTYVKGLNVQGKVKAVDYNNVPLPNMKLYLLGGDTSSRLLNNLTTDANGVATFSFSPAIYSGNIGLYVSNTPALTYPYRTPYYQTGYVMLSVAQPVSGAKVSSLVVQGKDQPLPCGLDTTVSIQYTVVGETQGTMYLTYLVLSRGTIKMQGTQKIKLRALLGLLPLTNEGQVSFKLTVSPEMAPDVQVVAYAILPSETVIADSADFSTEKCFRNNVSVAFNPPSAVPGENITLQVTADPGSLCGVGAVDQSVFIMEPGKNLNADKIFNLLPVQTSIPYELQDSVCLNGLRGSFLPSPKVHNVLTVFQNVGLKIATNLVQQPSCTPLIYNLGFGINIGIPFLAGVNEVLGLLPAAVAPVAAPNAFIAKVDANAPPVVTIRFSFPETWVWQLVVVGEPGTTDVSLTVPDTITTWETEAFCLSPQGFGLAPPEEITIMQPFFLELTLPYSIIRGENFELKATVFNYLSSCMRITVTPGPSADYILIPFPGDQYTSCLCGSERKTLHWTLIPSSLGSVKVSVKAEAVSSPTLCQNAFASVPDRGRIDVVTKPLIVKAEGSEVTQTYNWLLCPRGNTSTQTVNASLPTNVISGSVHGSVSVVGDILGRALQNLDGLLQMPSGCGEQNMILLAPDIYILQYLSNTNQLTTAIREKATNFLISGYQRQLNYKDDAGAYSTFGSGPGNTWLTAFVVRCFAKAQSFIYIDPATIEQSKTWLISKQKPTGCFEMSGKLFHSTMKGGVSDEVTLSAYITAAFLEMNTSVASPVITKSLSCLKNYISINDTYTKSLLAYVFTLAGDLQTRTSLLQQLDSVAIKQGGFLYWSQSSEETSASLSVEISSYVLLAKLSASPTAEDLGYCSSIVRWLTGTQNQFGGFFSTQDTVVALQALALYSTLVFSPTGSSSVLVQTPSGQLTFTVDQDNKLLYQEQTLQDTTGNYSLEVKGTACVSVQISITFNIPTPRTVMSLSATVQVQSNACTSPKRKVTLNITALYSGKQNSTNMVILDIKLLSGFVPDPESLTALQTGSQVAKVEQTEDRVVVYINELFKGTAVECRLDIVEEIPVQNRKPAVVTIYDYYEPSNKGQTAYTDPCSTA